uniref:BTB domain-containing protein n=2 Tax=Caenorhabditis tropicalis TaxID=1561998 RepID=A0A1I7TGP0_9PELO
MSDENLNNRELAKEVKTIRDKQEIIMKEIRSIQQKMNGKQLSVSKAANSDSSTVPTAASSQKQPSIPLKHFIIKHTFKNISKIPADKRVFTDEEEHFGIKWSLQICYLANCLACFVKCNEPVVTQNKLSDTNIEMRIGKKGGGKKCQEITTVIGQRLPNGTAVRTWLFNRYIEWEQLKKEFLIDDDLVIEFFFEIKKMTGIYKDNLREFDETMEEFSDVVLVVKEQKFFVLSKFLAAQSSYFKAMFLGHFDESSQSEIKLSGIDADDFQNYLEVLYGEPAIDEYTVEGILMVSDMYDTQSVIRKCEEFLLKESKKTLKKKLAMAVRYNLEKLKSKCLSEVTDVNILRSVIPGDFRNMEQSILADLLEKSLSFQ